jgi:hypothetical protein
MGKICCRWSQRERLRQHGRYFFNGVVIARLRTINSSLNGTLIANTMETAERPVMIVGSQRELR